MGAQGYTDKYGALGTFGGWPRVPAAFVPKAAARRRASRLAAGGVPLHPTPRPWGAGVLEGKRLGCGVTAARRRASRLAAGGVPLHPTPRPWGAGVLEGKRLGCGVTAARRQASRLAGLVRLPAAWPMAFRNPPARGKSDRHPLRRKRNPCKGCVCPTPTAGEQSGDRQRREKGPPILTAEKGELRARTIAGVSWPTPLRAT